MIRTQADLKAMLAVMPKASLETLVGDIITTLYGVEDDRLDLDKEWDSSTFGDLSDDVASIACKIGEEA